MEGIKKIFTKILAWLGLLLLAGGLWYYSGNLLNAQRGLYFAAAGAAVLLAAAFLTRQKLAAFFKLRSTRLGFSSLAGILAALLIVLALGSLGLRHSWQWDFTQESRYTLASQTEALLKTLDSPVEVYAFTSSGQPGRQVLEELFSQYNYINPQFTYQFVDPNLEPGVAQRYNVRSYGTVVVVHNGKHESAQSPGEQEITNAILKLSRPGQKTVYFLAGHGELAVEDESEGGLSLLKDAVERQNYLWKPLQLTAEGVPADAAALLVAAPQKDLLPAEVEALDKYFSAGGGIALLTELEADGGLKPWLEKNGVLLNEDLIVDELSQLMGASPLWPTTVNYGEHLITKPLRNTFCYFPLSHSVKLLETMPEGLNGEVLIRSNNSAMAVTDQAAVADPAIMLEENFTLDPAKVLPGPLDMAVLVTKSEAAGEEPSEAERTPAKGRLLVFGDADFAVNGHLPQAGNQDLILNALSFLAEEQELISIRPKEVKSDPLYMRVWQAHVIQWLPFVLMPLAFLCLGIFVVLRRRSVR